MAGTRRTPIDRPPRPIIDAESLRLFRRGSKLIDDGLADSKEYMKIKLLLHRRLGLKPWHENVFDVDFGYVPVDPHQFRDWKYVTSLRDQLAALAWPRPRLVEGEQRDEAGDTGHAEPPP